MNTLSDDAKAILLLCAPLERETPYRPLTDTQYHHLAVWLHRNGRSPRDLFSMEPEAVAAYMEPERFSYLLGRGVQLGLAMERWAGQGIWFLCRSDNEYPRRYKLLAKDAPAILFGTGNKVFLNHGGLAVVGSRNIDQTGAFFAESVALRCAREHITVISGGAKGTDSISMNAALKAHGHVIGVLADQLHKASLKKDYRDSLADGNLLLLSPYAPDTPWRAWQAMQRNKLIYALADYALVVSSGIGEKSGTWAGATEELKRKGTVFVRMDNTVPEGNKDLINKGAIPWPALEETERLTEKLPEAVASGGEKHIPQIRQGSLLDMGDALQKGPAEHSPAEAAPCEQTAAERSSAEKIFREQTAYDLCLPLILKKMGRASFSKEELTHLAEELGLLPKQLETWLNRAVKEKAVVKHCRPVRYTAASPLMAEQNRQE